MKGESVSTTVGYCPLESTRGGDNLVICNSVDSDVLDSEPEIEMGDDAKEDRDCVPEPIDPVPPPPTVTIPLPSSDVTLCEPLLGEEWVTFVIEVELE